MLNIVLLCAGGVSTGVLVKKIKAEADKAGCEINIAAYPMSEAKKRAENADLVLLGPQVRYNLETVKNQVSCPVEPIDMRAYGMMDGKKVLTQIQMAVGEKGRE